MKGLEELGEIIDKEIAGLLYPKSPDLLYAPIKYIMGLQAKRIRPLLVLIAHQLFDTITIKTAAWQNNELSEI